jgi:hypothetical protein
MNNVHQCLEWGGGGGGGVTASAALERDGLELCVIDDANILPQVTSLGSFVEYNVKC